MKPEDLVLQDPERLKKIKRSECRSLSADEQMMLNGQRELFKQFGECIELVFDNGEWKEVMGSERILNAKSEKENQ